MAAEPCLPAPAAARLVVVMPAYQAEKHVQSVLSRLFAVPGLDLARVIVVNDGSRDATSACVRAAQSEGRPLELLERRENGGYGAAMQDGLGRARAFDPAVTACIHADGQYSPEALPDLVRALCERKLDLLQGSRIASGTARSGGMPLYKIAANAALNVLENSTFKLNMTDYHSGYLLYGKRALALPFERFSRSFDFDLEVIAAASARGLVVAEAPVPTHYGDEVSHLNPISYGLRVLRVVWNYRRGRYANAVS